MIILLFISDNSSVRRVLRSSIYMTIITTIALILQSCSADTSKISNNSANIAPNNNKITNSTERDNASESDPSSENVYNEDGYEEDMYDEYLNDEDKGEKGLKSQAKKNRYCDPYIKYNTRMFELNKPIVRLLPNNNNIISTSLKNFFINSWQPTFALNSILQLNFHNLCLSIYRFVFNTIFGIGGLIDMASIMSIPQNLQLTFNDTLSEWNINSGSYIVLPVFGPFTVRGIIGAAFDLFANPIQFAFAPHYPIYYAIYGGEMAVISLQVNKTMYDMSESSFDQYSMMRSIYLQKFGKYSVTTCDSESDIVN